MSEASFRVAADVLFDRVPFLSFLAGAVDVGLQLEVIEFLLQFAIAAQAIWIEFGGANGAAGLFIVRAVAKPALPCQIE